MGFHLRFEYLSLLSPLPSTSQPAPPTEASLPSRGGGDVLVYLFSLKVNGVISSPHWEVWTMGAGPGRAGAVHHCPQQA